MRCASTLTRYSLLSVNPPNVLKLTFQMRLLDQTFNQGQYCGNAHRALLHRHGTVRSQSRRGQGYDTVPAEGLGPRFKTEEIARHE